MTTTEATSVPLQFPGELVQIDPRHASPRFPAGEVWVIDAVPGYGSRSTKTKAHALLDPMRKVGGSPLLFISSSHERWVGERDTSKLAETVPAEPAVHLAPGVVFEHKTRPGLWVITGDTAGKFRAFPLGGGSTYIRGLTVHSVKRIITPVEISVAGSTGA